MLPRAPFWAAAHHKCSRAVEYRTNTNHGAGDGQTLLGRPFLFGNPLHPTFSRANGGLFAAAWLARRCRRQGVQRIEYGGPVVRPDNMSHTANALVWVAQTAA